MHTYTPTQVGSMMNEEDGDDENIGERGVNIEGITRQTNKQNYIKMKQRFR